MLHYWCAAFLLVLPAAAQQTGGIENPWDVQTILKGMARDTAEQKSIVDNLRPQQWVDQKGAPSAYLVQWQTAGQQLKDAAAINAQLMNQTGKLPLALDLYFRIEALDVTLRNLEAGIRSYSERATADKLARVGARSFNDREKFRDYLRDLSSELEQNFKIADTEAQRCRGIISKEPAANAKKKLRK